MRSLPIQTSFKYHLIIGLAMSLWLVAFLIVIGPFDVAELRFEARLVILPFYGVITFVAYIVLIPFQNWYIRRFRRWTLLSEVIFIVALFFILLFSCYRYYKTDLVRGDFPFLQYALEIYLPIFLVILTMLVFARRYLNKKVPNKEMETILLKGANKLDVLQLHPKDLVCISSADNYVEVSYLKNGVLEKKLLRSTLKTMESEAGGLLRVHRSHLINPDHFIEWKGSSSIALTQTEVAVSKNYKQAVIDMNHSSLKGVISPQSP